MKKILSLFKRHWIIITVAILALYFLWPKKPKAAANPDQTNSTVPDPADDQYLSFLNQN